MDVLNKLWAFAVRFDTNDLLDKLEAETWPKIERVTIPETWENNIMPGAPS